MAISNRIKSGRHGLKFKAATALTGLLAAGGVGIGMAASAHATTPTTPSAISTLAPAEANSASEAATPSDGPGGHQDANNADVNSTGGHQDPGGVESGTAG